MGNDVTVISVFSNAEEILPLNVQTCAHISGFYQGDIYEFYVRGFEVKIRL